MKNLDQLSSKTKSAIEQIDIIIKSNKSINDRIIAIEAKGFDVQKLAMGSGGVGHIKIMQNGTVRVQISHGVGKYNYAWVVVLSL